MFVTACFITEQSTVKASLFVKSSWVGYSCVNWNQFKVPLQLDKPVFKEVFQVSNLFDTTEDKRCSHSNSFILPLKQCFKENATKIT